MTPAQHYFNINFSLAVFLFPYLICFPSYLPLFLYEYFLSFAVNRLDKEFGGHYGLLLPDATRLPAEFDILFSNLQVKTNFLFP